MVSRARRVPPEAEQSGHAQGVERVAGHERQSVGEHANVKDGEVECE